MHTNAFGSLLVLTVAWQPAPVKAQAFTLGETVRPISGQISESITRRITQSALREAEGRETEELIDGWVSPSYTLQLHKLPPVSSGKGVEDGVAASL